jgi:hypothetical protein
VAVNTSATGGYLTPTTALPADGDAFDTLLQAMIVGVTGLPGQYVVPRWQPEPPQEPPQNIDWCAIGETDSDPQGFSLLECNGDSSVQLTSDQVTVTASFYGPNCFAYAKLLRDGLQIRQNCEVLLSFQVNYRGPERITRVPELINNYWVDRADINLIFNRVQQRDYNILSLEESGFVLADSEGITVSGCTSQGENT